MVFVSQTRIKPSPRLKKLSVVIFVAFFLIVWDLNHDWES